MNIADMFLVVVSIAMLINLIQFIRVWRKRRILYKAMIEIRDEALPGIDDFNEDILRLRLQNLQNLAKETIKKVEL